MLYEFKVKEYPNTKNRIIVPNSVYHVYKNVRRMVNGPCYVYCDWLSHKKDNQTIFISSELMKQLQFQANKYYQFVVEDQSCMVHYQFGILTAGRRQMERHAATFLEMTQIGKLYGFQTFLFGYKDIDFQINKIRGYFFEDNQWTSTVQPIPKVIYNRLPNRKLEAHPKVKQAKQMLQSTSIIFNPEFFNKWQVYEIIMQDTSVHYLLPHTIFQPSARTLDEWIDNGDIYLKPIHGSKGNGIYHISKSNQQYTVHFYIEKKIEKSRHTDIESIMDTHFPNGFRNYVIQEAIPLYMKNSKKIDLRIHTNKNENNSWEMSLHYVRQAEDHLFTTHVSRGASIRNIYDIFSEKEATILLNKIEETVLSLSAIIDKYYSGKIGELGFDLGIDQEKKIWLLEVNAKPGWNIFDQPDYHSDRNNIFRLLYRYAYFLQNK
ncbi:YheC/YheD family protein [Gracilibacillus oryzae]|uniref:YheC/YheD family protein n=1 Tax=Gracilibacillus oryzae TaxID=1672701 RepID=A0A7C8KXS2_9BACI|nr:YheC/YheD family protein [Gracilibacillus oryzae]KAB8139041.1 YheC/YheD family protein [Gracilibacillus oryzae]